MIIGEWVISGCEEIELVPETRVLVTCGLLAEHGGRHDPNARRERYSWTHTQRRSLPQ